MTDHFVGDLQRAVELLLGRGLRGESHDDVVPLRLSGDFVREASLVTSPPVGLMTFVIRSTAVVTKASSASAGRMSMHSYSLNVHLLWSGRPPSRGSR